MIYFSRRETKNISRLSILIGVIIGSGFFTFFFSISSSERKPRSSIFIDVLFSTPSLITCREPNESDDWRLKLYFKSPAFIISDRFDAGIVCRLFLRYASYPNWILIRRQTELTKHSASSHARDIELTSSFSWTKLINLISMCSIGNIYWGLMRKFIKLFIRSVYSARSAF